MTADRSTDGLLEREDELAQLAALLRAARGGAGALALVEAPAGLGKTALLRTLRAAAGEQEDLRTLTATGGELERDFPFGIVRQLLEPAVLARPPEERAALLSGAAALAGAVLGAPPTDVGTGADAGFATLHGLYWLVAALADEQPLLLVVDDLHWADLPSLRFLDFLARRVDELPVLLLAGLRPAEPGAPLDVLAGLADSPAATTVRLRTLSAPATERLVADGLGDATPAEVAHAAQEATGGNPLLLRELLRTLAERPDGATAAAVRDAVPSSVTRSVQRRLARLDADAARLVRALAVVGPQAGSDLATIAGLEDVAARRAAADLVAAGLCERDPLAFAHPLLRTAVADGLPPDERAELHLRAVGVLRSRGEEEEQLVLHLLAAPPLREPWVAGALRASARRALAEGAFEAGVRRLTRCVELLDPLGAAAEREDLLLELAQAELGAGAAHALRRVHGLTDATDPRVASAALSLEIILYQPDPVAGMRPIFERLEVLLPRLDSGPARRQRRRMLDAAALDVRLGDRWAGLLDDALAQGEELPHLVFARAASDVPADELHALARRVLAAEALDDPALVEDSSTFWAVIGMIGADAGELTDAALRTAEATVRRSGLRIGGATTALIRAEWALQYGSMATAEAEARSSIALWDGIDADTGVRITLARALVRMGRFEEAEAELGALPPLDHRFVSTSALAARAEVRMHQRRFEEAVQDLEAVHAVADRFGWQRLPYLPTHTPLVRALVGAGRGEEARALAEAQVSAARVRRLADHEAEALLALGQARGRDGLEALQAAAKVAESSQALWTRACVHLELGAALRRANRRTEARARLALARDLAERIAAAGVLARATEELVLAGGRPVRTALTGIAALTPSERRVAEHAARGLKNREIAETLFVTRKTVEYTLGNVFAKLDVRSRTQLAPLLAAEEGAGAVG